MADGISMDFSEVLRLAATFENVPKEIKNNIPKALAVTSRHIKDDWAGDVAGSNLAPGGEGSITYDLDKNTVFGSDIFRSEIGPELGGSGSLVGLIEYGTATSGPRGFGAAALERNVPDFEKGITQAAEDAEKAAGL